MTRRKIPANTQAQVRQQANQLCEYCHTNESWQYVSFTIDHIIPLVEGGSDTVDNLALACFHCNRRKAAKQSALDPETETVVPLFNPRLDEWSVHFKWSIDGLYILPQTAIGRATAALLLLNRERVVLIRAADVEVGRHPPAEDSVEVLSS